MSHDVLGDVGEMLRLRGAMLSVLVDDDGYYASVQWTDGAIGRHGTTIEAALMAALDATEEIE